MDITLRELSDRTNKHINTVRSLLRNANIPVKDLGPGRPKMWDSYQALCAVLAPDIAATAMPDTVDLDYNAERARLTKEQADEKELKNEVLRGELIPIDDVKTKWARIVVAIRTQFLALPDRLAQMLETVSTPRERREMIDAEVRTILTALSEDD